MKNKKSNSNLNEMTFVIQSLFKIYKEISSEKVQDEIIKTIKTLLSPDFWGERHAVSLKAQKFAKKKGYNKPLELSSWNDLGNKKLKDRENKIRHNDKKHNGTRGLILEHIILRSDIIKLLLNCNLANPNEIRKIVENTRCAVIHWEEDDKLTEDGYGDKRPNPKEAYEEINLLFPSGYKNISDFIDLNWVNENIKSLYIK
jgi:hypothetical protein